MPSAPDPHFVFVTDPDAAPGDVIPALAALLLGIVDRHEADPPAVPPRPAKRRRGKRAKRRAA